MSNLYYLLAAQASSFLIHPQSARTPLVAYHSLSSTCVTYGMPCHANGQQVLPIIAKEAEDFPKGENSGLLFIYVKIMSLLTCGEAMIKSSQSIAFLSIYQNIFKYCSPNKYIFKIVPSKNTFSKLLLQKIYIFKVAASKNTFSKLL